MTLRCRFPGRHPRADRFGRLCSPRRRGGLPLPIRHQAVGQRQTPLALPLARRSPRRRPRPPPRLERHPRRTRTPHRTPKLRHRRHPQRRRLRLPGCLRHRFRHSDQANTEASQESQQTRLQEIRPAPPTRRCRRLIAAKAIRLSRASTVIGRAASAPRSRRV